MTRLKRVVTGVLIAALMVVVAFVVWAKTPLAPCPKPCGH